MADRYKFEGDKIPGQKTDVLVLKGTSTNPEEVLRLGETAELSDSQHKRLSERYELRKTSSGGSHAGSGSSTSSGAGSSSSSENK